MKRKSKKTLHRESRIRGVESDRRRANKMNARFMAEIQTSYGLVPIRKSKPIRLTPRQKFLMEHDTTDVVSGMFTHKNDVSTKVPLYNKNWACLKSLGLNKKETRFHIKMKRIDREQRDLFKEPLNCRKRRNLLHMTIVTVKSNAA